jgi:hypothetical protein
MHSSGYRSSLEHNPRFRQGHRAGQGLHIRVRLTNLTAAEQAVCILFDGEGRRTRLNI